MSATFTDFLGLANRVITTGTEVEGVLLTLVVCLLIATIVGITVLNCVKVWDDLTTKAQLEELFQREYGSFNDDTNNNITQYVDPEISRYQQPTQVDEKKAQITEAGARAYVW